MQAHAHSLRSSGFISITFFFFQPLSLLPRRTFKSNTEEYFDRPLCVHVNPIVNSINGFFRYFFGKNFSARLLLLFQNSDYGKKNTKFEYYYDQRF